ncbi:hypothetical protein [Acinetobacter tandoii]
MERNKQDQQQNGQPYQSPKQRLWVAIRENRGDFTVEQVAKAGCMKVNSANDFVRALKNAGFVKVLREENIQDKKIMHYVLERDCGYNAPALRRDGSFIENKTEAMYRAMWNTLRITRISVNARELAAMSSNDLLRVTETIADSYLRILHQANYLRLVSQGRSLKQNKYQMLMHMNTGSKPPEVHSVKQVFDPNTSRVMLTQFPNFEEEVQHGTLFKLEGTEQ